MFPLTKILLPVDFSERCLGATRYAEALAAHFHAEITLLHVLEPIRYEFSTLEFGGTVMNDLVASRAAQAQEQIDSFLQEELEGVRVKRVLLGGDPAQKIVRYAHDERMNLIALPTHGYGPFRRFILGSVTAKVLHDADCPVWTGVHLEQAPKVGAIAFRNVVCALDLGPQSRKALSWAAEMASEFKARLVLVHAHPCIESKPGEYFDRDLSADLAKSAREELEQLRDAAGAEADMVVEGGDAPHVVCRAAQAHNADLLVIGRGSAAGLFGRLRTNAYAIIRQSPCPVVSV
ncbi:MAG: universal stress protein [Bryobacteraceae bacterium]|jgi:nucleotide-binding universal stress UspA family protein